MRKLLFVCTIVLMLCLCGCQAGESADTLQYGDAFSKAQAIAVISSDSSEVLETITDAEEIRAFTLALDVDQWELASLPEDAAGLGAFGFSQQKTVRFFDSAPDETLYDVGTLALYEGGYIGIEVEGSEWLQATFKVSEDTYTFLKAYFD